MRVAVLAVVSIVCATGPAMAQRADSSAVPRVIGNRANGFDYQPTPREVQPREMMAGILPHGADQAPVDRDLEELDRSLLRSEGLSIEGVPRFTSGE